LIRIDPRPQEISQDWLDRAEALTAELRACEDDGLAIEQSARKTAAEKRRAIIDNNSEHWRNLKRTLLGWSHNKCWYSELSDVGSDFHVDHFRPKGRTKNIDGGVEEGYWWLAFEWSNYRVAVAWCNSLHRTTDQDAAKGKGDSFPLRHGSSRATLDEDVDGEYPYLLDPLNAEDVLLMSFDETGRPIATVEGWAKLRVEKTVEILHLDAPRMTEERQRIWRQCASRLDNAAQALRVPTEEHSHFHDKTAKDWISEVREMLDPKHELSAVAHACVASSQYKWARNLLR
jgi:uncharacterized protein (TIGR02646 family)